MRQRSPENVLDLTTETQGSSGPGATASAVIQERRALLRRTEQLVRDMHPLPAGVVIATVVRCRDELMRMGVRSGLAVASESMARARLMAQHPRELQAAG